MVSSLLRTRCEACRYLDVFADFTQMQLPGRVSLRVQARMLVRMQAGNIPETFLPPDKFKQKAYIKDAETVRMLRLVLRVYRVCTCPTLIGCAEQGRTGSCTSSTAVACARRLLTVHHSARACRRQTFAMLCWAATFGTPAALQWDAHLNSLALLQYKQMYEESINEPEKFWGKIAEDFHWHQKVCHIFNAVNSRCLHQ